MVFNAIVGNDDDHPRNHAAIYSWEQKRWRLSPAFDVVPNPIEKPTHLALQLSKGHFDISRETVLADAVRFGFDGHAEAAAYLDAKMDRVERAFAELEALLGTKLRVMMTQRLRDNLAILR